MVWYEGLGTTDRRWLIADERGSIIAVTNHSGIRMGINTYDEYGVPGSGNIGRFQYTGQAWLPEIGLYYYKARMYSSRLGRFMQTDPIGYNDGMNMYGYVSGDPINFADPTGLLSVLTCAKYGGETFCHWSELPDGSVTYLQPGAFNGAATPPRENPISGDGAGDGMEDIVVTAVVSKPQKDDKEVQCAIANRDALNNPLNNVPDWRKNDLGALNFDLAWASENLAQDKAVGAVLGVYGGARAGVAAGRIAGSALATRLGSTAAFGPWGTAGAFVAGGVVASQLKYDQARVAALTARITQLKNCK